MKVDARGLRSSDPIRPGDENDCALPRGAKTPRTRYETPGSTRRPPCRSPVRPRFPYSRRTGSELKTSRPTTAIDRDRGTRTRRSKRTATRERARVMALKKPSVRNARAVSTGKCRRPAARYGVFFLFIFFLFVHGRTPTNGTVSDSVPAPTRSSLRPSRPSRLSTSEPTREIKICKSTGTRAVTTAGVRRIIRRERIGRIATTRVH